MGFRVLLRKQAQALDAELQRVKRQIDLSIYLKVSREELLQRLAGRVFCHQKQLKYLGVSQQ